LSIRCFFPAVLAATALANGEIGEIAARGPSVHLGYHNNPRANEQAFTPDGRFRTGDLGRYVDEASNIQLTGWSKEIINRGGKKFFPREVDARWSQGLARRMSGARD
jgi:non-ribosomal peptide synthetase component E (peptide arylation enzyme)